PTGGHGDGARSDRDDLRRHRPPRGPAGRHTARAGLPGHRAPDDGGCARRGAASGPPGDEGVAVAGRIIYLEVDDEVTSVAAPIPSPAPGRLALVLPYGSRVATSRINFRLL